MMATIYADQQSVIIAGVDSTGPDGAEFSTEAAFLLSLVVPLDQVGELLASYDPANQYSPSAEDSRRIARVVMDSLKAAAEEP